MSKNTTPYFQLFSYNKTEELWKEYYSIYGEEGLEESAKLALCQGLEYNINHLDFVFEGLYACVLADDIKLREFRFTNTYLTCFFESKNHRTLDYIDKFILEEKLRSNAKRANNN